MKRSLLAIVLLLWASAAQAVTLTWQDNSSNETGFVVYMLQGGNFVEVARVAANVQTYKDNNTEGVYQVRAYLTCPACSPAGDVLSPPSNTAARLNAPVIQKVE